MSRRRRRAVVMGSGQCTRRLRSSSKLIETLPGSVVARLPLTVQAVGCTGHFMVLLPPQDQSAEKGQDEGHQGGAAVQDDEAGAE
jgi:hypothetical protein